MLELSFEPDAVNGADWLELCCFIDYPARISKPVIDSYFERLHYKGTELMATDILKHVKWRQLTLPSYPFSIKQYTIRSKCKAKDALEYLFPLLLSTHDFFSETKITDWSYIGNLFELYCTASMDQLIGNALLIGNRFGRFSSDFDTCLAEACRIINEIKGPPHAKAKDFQDAGVDIISWRNFDQRKGQIAVLVQCASGKKWRKKGGDIKLKLWGQLVFWAVDPIKALAFPYAYDFDSPSAADDWIYYAYDAGLLLDRLRLARFDLSECKIDYSPIVEWSANQIDKIKTYQVGT